MNNYILFTLCLIIFVFNFYTNKKEMAAPSVLLSSGFLVSTFFFMINTNTWNYEISLGTALLICLAVFFFSFGCFFGKLIKLKNANAHLQKSIYEGNPDIFNFSKGVLLLFEFAAIASLVIRLVSIVRTTGRIDIFSGAIGAYRFTDRQIYLSFVISFLDPLIEFFSIVSCVNISRALVNKRDNGKKNTNIGITITILITCFAYNMISSSRIDIVYIFIYSVVINSILVTKTSNRKKHRLLHIFGLLIAFYVFVRIFFALGFLTGKSQTQTSMFDNLSIYFGSSIGAFDIYLKNFSYSFSNLFTQSIQGFSNFLRYFGINLRTAESEHMGYLMYGNMTHNTNVYTGLRLLLHDFDYIGMLFVLFLEGTIFQVLFRKMKIKIMQGQTMLAMIYIYIAPFILITSITDRIFTSLLTISSVLYGIYLYIANKILKMQK